MPHHSEVEAQSWRFSRWQSAVRAKPAERRPCNHLVRMKIVRISCGSTPQSHVFSVSGRRNARHNSLPDRHGIRRHIPEIVAVVSEAYCSSVVMLLFHGGAEPAIRGSYNYGREARPAV